MRPAFLCLAKEKPPRPVEKKSLLCRKFGIRWMPLCLLRELLVGSSDILLTSFGSLATAFGDCSFPPLLVVFPRDPLRWVRVGALWQSSAGCAVVDTSSTSLALLRRAGLTRSAASPLPTEPASLGFGGGPMEPHNCTPAGRAAAVFGVIAESSPF